MKTRPIDIRFQVLDLAGSRWCGVESVRIRDVTECLTGWTNTPSISSMLIVEGTCGGLGGQSILGGVEGPIVYE
jgi:hypothetical protein